MLLHVHGLIGNSLKEGTDIHKIRSCHVMLKLSLFTHIFYNHIVDQNKLKKN